MTANQIAFNNYIESARHNKVMEGYTGRQTSAQESQAHTASFTASESARHNRVEEEIKRGTLQVSGSAQRETARHNFVSEMLQSQKLDVDRSAIAENVRHNMASEHVQRVNLAENARHNVVSEGVQTRSLNEQTRHNKVNEELTDLSSKRSYDVGLRNAAASATHARAALSSAEAAQRNASASMLQAQNQSMAQLTNMRAVAESERHNKAVEKAKTSELTIETRRAETARMEAETKRKLLNSQNFKNYASGVSDVVSSANATAKAIGSILLGGN